MWTASLGFFRFFSLCCSFSLFFHALVCFRLFSFFSFFSFWNSFFLEFFLSFWSSWNSIFLPACLPFLPSYFESTKSLEQIIDESTAICFHQWNLMAKKFDQDVSLVEYAISMGSLKLIKWARENGCPWDENTCANTAENGHFELSFASSLLVVNKKRKPCTINQLYERAICNTNNHFVLL